MRKLCIGLLIGFLAGCAHEPTGGPAPIFEGKAGALRVLNDQLESEPRPYFSDGITSAKTYYRDWAQTIVTKVTAGFAGGHSPTKPRELKISVSSISCGGHYIGDCTVSVLVERGDGVKKLFTTPTRSGYPMDSALDKAIDSAVKLIVEDPSLTRYVGS